jgi:hypothetical protein
MPATRTYIMRSIKSNIERRGNWRCFLTGQMNVNKVEMMGSLREFCLKLVFILLFLRLSIFAFFYTSNIVGAADDYHSTFPPFMCIHKWTLTVYSLSSYFIVCFDISKRLWILKYAIGMWEWEEIKRNLRLSSEKHEC